MERDNLFTLSLGNVQPDDLIVVRFAWFQVLDHSQGTKSLLIPFTPGVRYIPGNHLLRSNRGKGTVDDTDQVPDASRISPPRIDQLHPDAALISLQGKLDARFIEKTSVSSATHPLALRDERESLHVTLPKKGHVPDRDFVLRWKESEVDALQLRSINCADEDSQYAVVRLDAPIDAPVAPNQSRDYYFLVDRSGSMEGAKWTYTAQALKAFVGELGGKDRVSVTLFESSFQDFAEAPLPVSELKNDPAFDALEELSVGGGTELLPALEHVLKQMPVHSKERDPVIIIITDGQVGNEAGVAKLLRAHRQIAVHTFGIDSAVNDGFLKQLAAQHRGACVLMTPNDDIKSAVSRLGNRLRRPVLTGLTAPAQWQLTDTQLPDIYAGEHILVALRGPRQAESLELSGKVADQSIRTFRFNLRPESAQAAAPRLLWARQVISRLLGEAQEKKAIKLAIKHNLICSGAAFIAYDINEKMAISSDEIYQPNLSPIPIAVKAVRASIKPCAPAAAACPSVKASMNAAACRLPDKDVTRIRHLHGFLEADTDSDSGPTEKERIELERFRNKYLHDLKPSTLRAEILLGRWNKPVVCWLPIFQSAAGKLLHEILFHWATVDVMERFGLLNILIEDLRKGKEGVVLKKFIGVHFAKTSMAQDLLWLLDNINKGGI